MISVTSISCVLWWLDRSMISHHISKTAGRIMRFHAAVVLINKNNRWTCDRIRRAEGLEDSGYSPYPGLDHSRDIYMHTEKPGYWYPCIHDKYQYPFFPMMHVICACSYDVYWLQHKTEYIKMEEKWDHCGGRLTLGEMPRLWCGDKKDKLRSFVPSRGKRLLLPPPCLFYRYIT